MGKSLLFRQKKQYRAPLLRLAAWKLLAGLCAAGAAWETSTLVDGVFLAHTGLEKAAPHLAVLLFLLSLRALSHLLASAVADGMLRAFWEEMREKLHASLLRYSPLSPKLSSSGNILSLGWESMHAFEDVFRVSLPLIAEGIVHIPLFFLCALAVDPWTALLFLLTVPLAPFLLYLIGKATQKANERQWQRLLALNQGFAELLRGILTLKIFGRDRAQLEQMKSLSDEFSAASLAVLRLAFVSAFALELITTLAIALVSVGAGLRLLYGQMEFLPAFFLLLIAPEFYQPIRQSGTAFHAIMQAQTAAKELEDFFLPPGESPRPPRTVSGQMPPDIYARGISYHYPGRGAYALQSLSFHAPAGKLTMLCGTSGSGKSTVLKLLAKFDAPQEGQILINDLPLSAIDPDFWHSRVAYVPQQPYLFPVSLRQNICLEDAEDAADATMPQGRGEEKDRRILAALREVSLGEWLSALPQGLDTPLGDGNRNLSFGEMRRIGLARAIYRDCPILLLDEITAGLDEENERIVIQAIKRMRLRHTILMSAHRPSVLAIADCVIQMDGGLLRGSCPNSGFRL